jgi:sugar phosphate isomerase/epimerase
MKLDLTRRHFIATGAAALAAALGTRPARAAVLPPVCVFSKHFQHLDYDALAAMAKGAGVDGIDLTVREGGHVPPASVAADLPRAVAAIRSAGLDVPMITTNLKSGADADAGPILAAAAEQGIPYFRAGGHKYSGEGDPLEEAKAFTEDLRTLTALAEQHGMTAGYHNHSGGDNFGAPVWDLLRALESVDSLHLGSNFDLGHATVEGAYGDWAITARALAPRVKMLAVKDFTFERDKPRWVPLGDGMVRMADYFRIFRERASFAGPISIHFEYGEFNRASDEEKVAQLVSAVKVVRRELDKAGYTA